MAVKLGSLLIELGLDSARFRSGTRAAERDMDRFKRGVTNGANAVKGAIVGMVGAIGVGVFTTAIRDGLEYASALGEVAQQLGVTTDSLQEYRYAATQVGLSTEEMDAALARLTRTIGATPEKLTRLGIAVRDANGNMRDAGDILPDLAEALQALDSPAQRAAVLVDLFGRSGQKLAPLLAEGAAGVNGLRDAAHRLGIVLSSDQIQSADDAADKLSAVQTVLQARIAGVVADNADEIVRLANALATLAEKAIKAIDALIRLRGQLTATNSARREAASAVTALPGESALQTQLRRNRASDAAGRRANADNPGSSMFGGLITVRQQRATPPRTRQRNFNDDLSDQALNGAPTVAANLREVTAAANVARPALQAVAPELQGLLDQLFPDRVARRELADNLKLLDDALRANQITLAQHAAATAQANFQYRESVGRVTDWAEGVREALLDVEVQVPSTEEVFGDLADHFERDADRLLDASERSQRAFYGVLDGLRGLSEGIKRGDIFSILEGVIGVLNGIGSSMPGGLNIGGLKFGSIPGFANGTNFAPGGLAWVGERGRELVNLPRGSQVIPNNKLGGMGGSIAQIVPSPYFDVVVDGRVQRAAPGIAGAGAKGAMQASQRIGQRRLA